MDPLIRYPNLSVFQTIQRRSKSVSDKASENYGLHMTKNQSISDKQSLNSNYHDHASPIINQLSYLNRNIISNKDVQPSFFQSDVHFNFANIQTKLKVSQPGDVYEQEADLVAKEIMRMSSQSLESTTELSNTTEQREYRKCKSCEEGEKEKLKISRKTSQEMTNLEPSEDVTRDIDNTLHQGGSPLDASTREFMESRFGFDFSKVRIHNDEKAAVSARTINALAYTVDENIVFGAGQYRPRSLEGQRLLMHELVHIVQQAPTRHTSSMLQRQSDDHPFISFIEHLLTPLTPTEQQAAIRFNRVRFQEEESVRTIQRLVKADTDGNIGPQTVQHIAQFQIIHSLNVDGKIGENTLEKMVAELNASKNQDEVINLIIDFYNFNRRGAIIFFDPSLVKLLAETRGGITTRATVRIGPDAFNQSFAGLIHTIAHELEHVRLRKIGVSFAVDEFLSESIEILSRGMPIEDLAGFMEDAEDALQNFNLMTLPERRTHFARFEKVRNEVRRRFNAATSFNKAIYLFTMFRFDAITHP
jgi:hypothetical protein